MTYRCSCGFRTTSLERFEDHLVTFPEDDHYELASGHQGYRGTTQPGAVSTVLLYRR